MSEGGGYSEAVCTAAAFLPADGCPGPGNGAVRSLPHWGAWSWQAVVPVPSSEEENNSHRQPQSLGDSPESGLRHSPALWPPVLTSSPVKQVS